MAAAIIPDQKTMGRTLTPQASGPHVLLSCLLKQLSLDRHQKLKDYRKTAERRASKGSFCLRRLKFIQFGVRVSTGRSENNKGDPIRSVVYCPLMAVSVLSDLYWGMLQCIPPGRANWALSRARPRTLHSSHRFIQQYGVTTAPLRPDSLKSPQAKPLDGTREERLVRSASEEMLILSFRHTSWSSIDFKCLIKCRYFLIRTKERMCNRRLITPHTVAFALLLCP